MYIDNPWSVKVTKSDDNQFYASGFGIGLTIPEPKPFIIVDGVIYINSTMIKDATIQIKDNK